MANNTSISALFCGDFAPCRRWCDAQPNVDVFGELQSHIKNVDLAFVNLETPASNVGKPILKDGPNLNTKPEWLKPLKDVGFNLIGLANNHMGDFGPENVNDCIENCEKLGLSTVGAGKNLEAAQKIYYFEKNKIKLAVIAVCEHEYGIAEKNKAGTAPLDIMDNIRQIQEAKRNADFVIITIHGGNEYFPYPRPGLRKLCQFYVEQGCDAVVCHHPHVPGGYEIFNEKPIFYSIGNFIFDNDKPPLGWCEGYGVKLFFNISLKKVTYELLPYTQCFEQGGLKLLKDNNRDKFINRINGYKAILYNYNAYDEKWTEFCNTKKDNYLMVHYLPVSFRGIGRLLKLFNTEKVLVGNTKHLTGRLNFIRCESHREVILYILKRILIKRHES